MDIYLTEILFGGFLLLLVIGAPITVALGGAAMAAYLALDKDPIALVQIAFNSVGSFPLMALPAFVLAGALMEAAGISRRLVDIAETLAGPITGGLGAATVLACLLFGAISGSGPATTAAVGMLMIPAMTKRNYARPYASAITAASGGLGIIIPPSIPMIIFGIAALGMQPPPEAVERHGTFASLSIPKLFVAGVVPGIIMAGGLLVVNYIISRRNGYRGLSEKWSGADMRHALRRGVWAMLAPVIILGGIYTGLFTPTESAIVAIFYTLFVGFFIHRELKLPALQNSLRTTTWITGRVLLILFTATAFGRLLVEQRIPAEIAESLLASDQQHLRRVGADHRLPDVRRHVHGNAGGDPNPGAGAAAGDVHHGRRPDARGHRRHLRAVDRLHDAAAGREPVRRLGHRRRDRGEDRRARAAVRAGLGDRGVRDRLPAGAVAVAAGVDGLPLMC